MLKQLHSWKHYQEHVPGTDWGQAEDLEHWVVLMHGWAKQVTRDIRRIKACDGLQRCLADNKDLTDEELKALERAVNPDDPPDPPWGLG